MKAPKAFVITVAVLLGVLLIQLAVSFSHEQEPHTIAIWKNRPNNMAQAKRLANQIVTGRVTKIERADDLVVKAPGEPNDEVRIPVEVITITIEKSHKGGPLRLHLPRLPGQPRPRPAQQTVQVFHTGLSVGVPVKDRREPPVSERPPRPAGGVDKPAQIPKPTEEEARTVMLHDDPAYKVGERYVLLLMDGPAVKVRGTLIATKAPVSPEGRYRITADDQIEPVTQRGFAGQLKGKSVRELEAELRP